MGAVSTLPMELTHVANIFVLTRADPSPLSSKIAQSRRDRDEPNEWLFAALVPGSNVNL